MSIKNLPARYPEIGRIRFGDKGPKGEPRKGKTLRFSSNDDVVLKAIASQHGGDVVPWDNGEQAYHLTTETTTIPVYLPADPIDTWYEKWGKGGIQRRCDGERCTHPIINPDGGFMAEDDCLCIAESLTPGDREDVKHGACQVTVRLRVVIPDVPGIGVWMATSHSIYAAMELPGQVQLLEAMRERGQLVPAELAIDARSEKKPWEKYTRDYIVPVILVRSSLRQLQSGDFDRPALDAAPPARAEIVGGGAPVNGDVTVEGMEAPALSPPGANPGGRHDPPANDTPIPAAALRNLRSMATRKTLAEADLEEMVGKPLDTLTLDEGNSLLAKVSAYAADDGRPFA